MREEAINYTISWTQQYATWQKWKEQEEIILESDQESSNLDEARAEINRIMKM